jgi:uncharacterized protein (TIGR02145 family)
MKVTTIKKVPVIGILFLMFLSFTVNAQNLKDIDGNVYLTIPHGVQVWMASNLNVSKFRNGDIIQQAMTDEEWTNAATAGTPAWCFYENDPENGNKHGKLYNWFAINDPRGLAPECWHIPSNNDWRTLIKNLKGVDMAGSSLKSTTGWKSRKGTNKIGFAALPGGFRTPDGKFKESGQSCRWWSNSAPVEVNPSNQIYSIVLEDTSVEVKYLKSEKGAGFSVRCEKD